MAPMKKELKEAENRAIKALSKALPEILDTWPLHECSGATVSAEQMACDLIEGLKEDGFTVLDHPYFVIPSSETKSGKDVEIRWD